VTFRRRVGRCSAVAAKAAMMICVAEAAGGSGARLAAIPGISFIAVQPGYRAVPLQAALLL